MAEKPWGGRFEGSTDKSVEDFTTSLSFDRRLARQDIAGSMAHARMLARQGIITPDDGEQIVAGLTEIRREIETTTVEDIQRVAQGIFRTGNLNLSLIGPVPEKMQREITKNLVIEGT